MEKAEQITLVKSEPYAYSNSSAVSVKFEPIIVEIPDVTPPPEPTSNEKRLTYLVTQATLSSTLEETGTFLLARVPRTTGKYQLGLIRNDGIVVEPCNTLRFDGNLSKLTPVSKDIVKLDRRCGPAFFLTTEDSWRSWELIGSSSPGHKHFHMSRYTSQDLLGSASHVNPLLKDDFIIQSNDGVGVTLNLSHIKTQSPEFHRYLYFFSTGTQFLSMNYSCEAIKALVDHFYDTEFPPVQFETAVQLLKMVRDLRITDTRIIWVIEVEIVKYALRLPEAVYVWKISNGISQRISNHCLKHFRAHLYSLKTPEEFYQLFQSQQFSIGEIRDFLTELMETKKWK